MKIERCISISLVPPILLCYSLANLAFPCTQTQSSPPYSHCYVNQNQSYEQSCTCTHQYETNGAVKEGS